VRFLPTVIIICAVFDGNFGGMKANAAVNSAQNDMPRHVRPSQGFNFAKVLGGSKPPIHAPECAMALSGTAKRFLVQKSAPFFQGQSQGVGAFRPRLNGWQC
jgi:hypothetical protein